MTKFTQLPLSVDGQIDNLISKGLVSSPNSPQPAHSSALVVANLGVQ